jgi:hypothetical protein
VLARSLLARELRMQSPGEDSPADDPQADCRPGNDIEVTPARNRGKHARTGAVSQEQMLKQRFAGFGLFVHLPNLKVASRY